MSDRTAMTMAQGMATIAMICSHPNQYFTTKKSACGSL